MLLMSLVVLVLFVGLQRKLIYHPLCEPVLPAMAGPAADRLSSVAVTTADSLTLQGWRVAARSMDTAEPRRLTIYFQGNAAHRGRRGKQFTMLSDLGSEVLIVDYRGYGENPGVPSETGLREDARAVWKFATEELQYQPEEIVLFGESLGGGVATGLAAELCDGGVTPGGLILRATFTSLVDAGRAHYPFLPVNWVLMDRYPSEDRLPRITCPILVLHGDQDRIIPYSQGERLFAAAPEKSTTGIRKQFVRLRGAGHNDILYVAEREVLAALTGFYRRLP
jgi:fermentation-respiration switch protein FrsA (DUF1100 family)